MTDSLALGVTGALILVGLYGAMESRWPASYVDTTTAAGQLGRFSLTWYLAFRMGPAAVVSAVVAVSADRLAGSSFVAVAVCLTLFTLFGWFHIWRTAARTTHRLKYLMVAAIGALLSLTGGIVGGMASFLVARLIPQPAELLNAVWTAAMVAAAYSGLTRVLAVKVDYGAVRARARTDIGPDAWRYAAKAGQVHDIPVECIRAILLTEATQRPKWFRTIEVALQHVRRWFKLSGTTGVAQMRSVTPLSDERSIELLAQDMSTWMSWHRTPISLLNPEIFERYLRRHNADNVFITSAFDHFSVLTQVGE